MELSLILLIIMFVLVSYESFYTGFKKLKSKGIYEESRGFAFIVSVMTTITFVLDYKSKIPYKETSFTENSWILAIFATFLIVSFYRFWTRKDYTIYGITKEELSEIIQMRDKRFVAVHRGGLLTKDHHQLMRWARTCL